MEDTALPVPARPDGRCELHASPPIDRHYFRSIKPGSGGAAEATALLTANRLDQFGREYMPTDMSVLCASRPRPLTSPAVRVCAALPPVTPALRDRRVCVAAC